MNAVLLLSAMMIAGSMTLTLGGYVDTMDMDADAEDAQQLIDIITKPRKPKDYHTVYEVRTRSLSDLLCLSVSVSLSLFLPLFLYLSSSLPFAYMVP